MIITDSIIRAVSCDKQFFAVAADTGFLVKRAAALHGLSPAMSILAGRALTAAAMLGVCLKDESSQITLNFDGDRRLSVTGNSRCFVKASLSDSVWMPTEGEALGNFFGINGFLTVVRDLGLKEPYTGKVPLVSGEIAEDLTEYYRISEQTAFCTALGVLLDKTSEKLSVSKAGGFIISAMPGCPESLLKSLDENIAVLPAVSDMLQSGMTEKDILAAALHGFDFDVTDTVCPRYFCGCGRTKVRNTLATLSRKELESLADEGGAELVCHYCNTKYRFSADEIKELIK